MARDPRKRPLYEVIGKAGSKPGYAKGLEQLHPESTDEPAGIGLDTVHPPSESAMRWPRRSSLVWLSGGRVEFSLPYQVAIAVVLGIVLLLLLSFRLGQYMGWRSSVHTEAAGSTAAKAAEEKRPDAAGKNTVASQQSAAGANNRIVIQMYQVRAHLEPVKQYFDNLGIQTEILQEGSWYYLITRNKYDSPDKPGTNGYMAKQKIIELGAKYKAPTGYETFAPRLFSDAFGKRFDQ